MSVEYSRILELREKANAQLLYYLREALKGDETLMKEVWEECRDDEETGVVKQSIRRWISEIEQMDQRP